MIGTAYQQGTHVCVISPEGQTLFTQQGKLQGFSSEVVSILKGNAFFICDHQGNTLSSHRYTDDKPAKNGSSKSILFYLLFGCLTKIGDVCQLYQFLGRLSWGNTFNLGAPCLLSYPVWLGIGRWM